ncbi:hypothetical protein DNTS_024787 [Danionella cerebrum]|uniref:Adrenomedullin 2b n=1 Tax=Danionella cerebrum TaxID=2873325 RepID=A0A553MZN3_9TELE|nr:hypothetical protein DNTS_024787 [Danionella translucida]
MCSASVSGRLPEPEGSLIKRVLCIPSIASSARARERRTLWRTLLHKQAPSRLPGTSANQNIGAQGHIRERRHTFRTPRRHAQLMRVRCVLGTCQVQNLSHRLYQLNSQTGLQEVPINPRSPHSYG